MNRTLMTVLILGLGIGAGDVFSQEVLPKPEPAFKGTIGKTYKESKPDFPKPLEAPAGAPNVLIVLLDDVGFGHAATFGGAVATPTLDRLAKSGLRYNRLHTTALCSPTRGALLTGRNHHSVGTGVIIELGTGYPGYTGIVPNSTAGLPEILRQNGYTTSAFGKWHNTPDNEITPSGPFDRWPTGKTWGFEYFYGFMNGETHQYYPVLYRNTTPTAQPKTPEQGYHVTEDIVGDNGASGEGGLEGTVNEIASLNGIQLGLAGLEAKFDEIGGPDTEPHVPAAWAWAANTPFQWTKQVASHFGGTRNGLVVHWPKGIAAKGELRSQFHHIIDVAPTVLEAAHITQTKDVNGVKQKPIQGVSMVYSFDNGRATSHRTTQYFEMFGNRGIYKDGWMATTRHGRLPWQTGGASLGTFDSDPWELYHVDEDFSQADNLAARYPDKVKALQAAFLVEANKYNVLPLDDRLAERFAAGLRPNPLAGLKKFSYGPGVTGISESAVLDTHGVPFSITADVELGEAVGEGVLAAIGGVTSGWSLYVKEGKPTFYYNFFEVDHARIQSSESLPKGKSSIRVEFMPVEPGPGKPADVKLFVNGKETGNGRVGKTVPFRYSVEPFDIGRDTVSAVSKDYQVPFAFNGRIDQVTIETK